MQYRFTQTILHSPNAELMRRAHISANIITKIKNGQYIALEKVESICKAMNCTPNDMMEFIKDSDVEDDNTKAEVSR